VAEGSISSFVAALLAGPVGVTLLDRLEADSRDGWFPFDCLPDSAPDAVARATDSIARTSLGSVLERALHASEWVTGSWAPCAPQNLAHAYRYAAPRRPIAEAFAERFWSELHRSADRDAQQWWEQVMRPEDWARFRRPDYEEVYGNGEFTWRGLWTVTDPPQEIHRELASAWELDFPPISRWALPVHADSRVWTIDRPDDWVRLVENYPKVAVKPHSGWELPGPNQHHEEISPLLGIVGQHGVRESIQRQVLPDWRAVSVDYDGVHLSWAGFLTSEGYVEDLNGGGVTMLRYWSSERTLWLNDVFGEPTFLDFAVHQDSRNDRESETRKGEDLRRLNTYLGRPGGSA
jgi:hypothetical protein